jgi:hypothetical protein
MGALRERSALVKILMTILIGGVLGAGTIQPASTKTPLVSFTKIPPAFVDQTITSGPDVPLMVFDITASRAKDVALTQLQFMIFGGMLDGSGPLPSGYLTNFRLLYFPKGLGGPSTVVGVNDGLAWTPGFTSDTFLRIDLTQAFALKNNFDGVFALIADVSGAPARFQPHLQVAMVNINGVDQALVNPETCDLPLAGDGFIVN